MAIDDDGDSLEVVPVSGTRERLLEQEEQSSLSGLVEFIQDGLGLEYLQATIKHETDQDTHDMCITLLSSLQSWRISQHHLFPFLQPLPPVDEEKPEQTPLLLPSSFTLKKRESLHLTEAANSELQLRCGHVYDILSDLQDTIHEYNHVIIEKRINQSSQNIATCTHTEIAEIWSRMMLLKNRYMHSYSALLALGYSTNEGELRPLEDSELWGKSVWVPHTTGDSSKQNPWFWSVGRPEGVSEDMWLMELERVRWFRERVAVDRLREEVEILEEEFRRTHKSFSRISEVWTALADVNSSKRGYACYAQRQAHMFTLLANDCWLKWKWCVFCATLAKVVI
ncbi:hypothetical protein P691DRAFT_765049 [Macrolepiota fuliginosa MF-IS2]|uniref:Uncharacterized protein n=1 Tax=Macrolepiota fuliginosa MF-IS2 TaxID=1400762 RepID=A0A9P5X0Y7_9AGAR|nr:hypothetical protein P691DRAFT_765049 [Macrolepiota fuliginosa MF-IS2]